MANKIIHILFCYFLFSTALNLTAAPLSEEKTDVWDRSKIEYRHPSVEKMESYKHMDEYIYDSFEEPDSWWEQFKRWIWEQISSADLTPKILLYVLIGIAALILLAVTLMLLGVKPSGIFIFKRNNQVTPLNFKAGEEDIYNEDLDQMLQTCIKHKAYREAIRLLYLLCIRELDESEWITWKPWKTNKDYYYELKNTEHRTAFKQLVLNYEYSWYGQFAIDQSHFEDIQLKFKHFQTTILTQKPLKEKEGHETKHQ